MRKFMFCLALSFCGTNVVPALAQRPEPSATLIEMWAAVFDTATDRKGDSWVYISEDSEKPFGLGLQASLSVQIAQCA